MKTRNMYHNLFSCDGPGIRLGGLSSFQMMLIPTDQPNGFGTGAKLPTSKAPIRHQLVITSLSLIIWPTVLFAILSSCILPAQSVINPPHKSLFDTAHRNNSTSQRAIEVSRLSLSVKGDGDDVPYLLTISSAYSVSLGMDDKFNISVNLNRAVPEDVSVLVSVNSGPDLIAFDKSAINGTVPSIETSGNGTNEHTIIFKADTFGDRVVSLHTNHFAGHAEIVCRVVKQPKASNITIDDRQAFVSVNIYRNWNLNVIIQIVGGIYFVAWSTSFYFQVIVNYQRKSVVGLNFDFLILNLLGFACYSIYNFTLMFSYAVQQEYYKRYAYSRIPVEYNDLFFALHAFAITLVTVIQCFIYERGNQQVSLPAGIFVCLVSALGFILFVVGNFFHALSILDVVLYLSYVKLVITIIKYSPQAYMNYKRKATTGWSIHNIILDFTGGAFSILQMLLIAYNYNDWISIFGNATKFGLGLFSMAFDILFFVQHYVLYRSDQQHLVSNDNDLENSSDSVPSPIISQSIRSANMINQTAASNDDLGANRDSSDTD